MGSRRDAKISLGWTQCLVGINDLLTDWVFIQFGVLSAAVCVFFIFWPTDLLSARLLGSGNSLNRFRTAAHALNQLLDHKVHHGHYD